MSDMDFSWQINDCNQSLQLKLAEGIVSPEFLRLLDKINRDEADEQHHNRLETLKMAMTEKIWALDLEQAFPNTQLTKA